MRLIDADRLKAAIHTDFSEHFTLYHDTDQTALFDMVMDDIDEMPTAFDKEKVIRELSKKRYEALKMRDDENTSCTTELKSFWHSRLEAYTLAIEIIEKGGIE